jgi:hypothetical protein|tara:strand:- start:169 stop:441 length:273 start_codon:yes stop_codon:yes gene_type:complete
MFILTVDGKESDGAYSVKNDDGDHILYIFEEEDDAVRYAMMLEDNDYPEMHVIEIDGELMLKTCENHGYQYSVITKNDIVIPPEHHDFVS